MDNNFERLRPSLIKILRKVENAHVSLLTIEKNDNNMFLFENAFITGHIEENEITNVVLTDKGFDALDHYYVKTKTMRLDNRRFWAPVVISIIALALTIFFNLDKVLSLISLFLELFQKL
jgi:uncharacterized protein YybS (DUF2232 family)